MGKQVKIIGKYAGIIHVSRTMIIIIKFSIIGQSLYGSSVEIIILCSLI